MASNMKGTIQASAEIRKDNINQGQRELERLKMLNASLTAELALKSRESMKSPILLKEVPAAEKDIELVDNKEVEANEDTLSPDKTSKKVNPALPSSVDEETREEVERYKDEMEKYKAETERCKEGMDMIRSHLSAVTLCGCVKGGNQYPGKFYILM